MDSCQFVDGNILKVISENCHHLNSLSLSSCTNIATLEESLANQNRDGFENIQKLKKLENLNLYRTLISTESAIVIIKACKMLKVINFGACVNIVDFDLIMDVLAENNQSIECLDLWRAYSLTNYGVSRLAASCTKLQELDIGWW